MTEYRGFIIDKYNHIFKNGKQVFTARWQDCYTLSDAKATIDNSLAGVIIPEPKPVRLGGSCELENGAEAAERFAERVDAYWEWELDQQIK